MLVVGDLVFVTAAHEEIGPYGSQLYALNAATGAVAWGPVELGGRNWWSGLAYDNGKVFALNGDNLMRAYNAVDGTPLWSTQLPEAFDASSPPTAVDGIVYTASYGWEGGGLAQQGFPISVEMQETSATGREPYMVQYFERAVFEYHPENRPPNRALPVPPHSEWPLPVGPLLQRIYELLE